MRICAACSNDLPQDGFSKTQWKLPACQRRCKSCIAANREVPEKTAMSVDDGDGAGGTKRWICLCEEDDAGEPAIRDCSCRSGAAGYHVSCLITYAKAKSGEIAVFMEDPSDGDHPLYDPVGNAFVGPWTTCPNCKQSYCHGIALKLADALISFIGKIDTF